MTLWLDANNQQRLYVSLGEHDMRLDRAKVRRTQLISVIRAEIGGC